MTTREEIPYFDISKYPENYDPKDPNITDLRHIQIIYAVIQWTLPHSVAEFGCWNGATSVALVECVKKNAIYNLSLVDIKPRPAVKRLANPQITVYDIPTYKFFDEVDAIIIDADHGIGAVADISTALYRRVPVIICHDVAEHQPYDWGPAACVPLFNPAGYSFVIDAEKREGERTERGLLVAWLPEYDSLLNGKIQNLMDRNDKWWETK